MTGVTQRRILTNHLNTRLSGLDWSSPDDLSPVLNPPFGGGGHRALGVARSLVHDHKWSTPVSPTHEHYLPWRRGSLERVDPRSFLRVLLSAVCRPRWLYAMDVHSGGLRLRIYFNLSHKMERECTCIVSTDTITREGRARSDNREIIQPR